MGVWLAAGASLASAGIGFAGAEKSSKAAEKAAKAGRAPAKALERIHGQLQGGQLFGLPSEAFTGKKPDFAAFNRIDPGQEASKAALGSRGALGDIAGLQFDVNSINQFSDALRFERLFPGGMEALRSQGQAASSLSRGELPFDDIMGIARNRSGLANKLGLGGTQFSSALPRDLGMSRLQAIQAGASLTSHGAATLNTISPQSQQMRAQDNFLTGPQQIDLSLRQNLLQQQSDQARFNLEASPEPLAQALLGLEKERLHMYSTGQLAGAQIQSANALATSQQQADSLSQIASMFGQGGSLNGLFSGNSSVPYNPNTQVVQPVLR